MRKRIDYWCKKGFVIGAKTNYGIIQCFELSCYNDILAFIDTGYYFIKELELLPDLPTKVAGYTVGKFDDQESVYIDGFGYRKDMLQRLLIEKSLTKEDIEGLLRYFN